MKQMRWFLMVVALLLAVGLQAADPTVTDALTVVGTTWTAVLTAGLVILGGLLAVAVVKKVRRFF